MADTENQLNSFRRWVRDQQPILNSIDTDEFLLRFLRITNFNLDNAKEWLVRFWKHRTENPQWFTDRDLLKNPVMCEIAATAYYLQLPKETKSKEHIAIMRMACHDPTKYSLDDVTKYAFAVTDILNRQENVQTHGFIILLDLSDVKLHHISQFTPDRTHRYVDCWEKMYPVKLNQIHFYNYPRIFDPILHLFRMFLSRKISEKIFLHPKTSGESTNKALHQYLDPSLLPAEYGGQLGPIEDVNKTFIQWVKQQNYYILQLDQYSVDPKQASKILKTMQNEQD
ncbi:unnamed protein product [Rotaria magnacalcarata]|uniref:CRAL-TRIO domain-containing protein n=2 Tax=Rotaria magnacalcarata TaxID=392030 RepID=A0A816KKX0_9BILA|nr:unnamed protein product [Rotaria magnacalcarata]CAF1613543.1 unnamed protein product [Rotaria magnacalcarata]CAF1928002.1 unnamed protein product [Rotaria magnacalcarata]CAF4777556.1 unnamed protein product [Rotaria magnacalcarata]CAF5041554.1 unnamed protein product [Rotaria magnacalcarata]